MREERGARFAFCALWLAAFILKLCLAARLPLFVDEAFYWQESRHLALAYSDLPGLTAWLIGLGTAFGGDSLLGVRWPFLLLGAALPWLVVAMARPLGGLHAWRAGALTVLFPLSGFLGVLALPDVPMNLAAAACLLGGARLLRGVDGPALVWLAAGLVLGALSHYRFVAVIAVGVAALLILPQGRAALRDRRTWMAIGIGALAWLPLGLWNLTHGDAGWRFQFVDRHPWALHADGWLFLPVQAALATPLLFVALLVAGWRWRACFGLQTRWLALCGGLTLTGFFVLGFFADSERTSFHWPLSGYLALLALVPDVLRRWPRALHVATWGLLGGAFVLALGVQAMLASSQGRKKLDDAGAYSANFTDWSALSDAVQARLAELPEGTRVLADHFKLGAELGFVLRNPDIEVLEHPLNPRHGRARQLELWGLLRNDARDGWHLLVISPDDVKLSARLARYQELCSRLGPLPAPDVVEVDGGARRFLLFALPPDPPAAPCVTPALAHLDWPLDGDTLGRAFTVRGWALKDVVGIDRIEVLVDGERLAETERAAEAGWVVTTYGALSRDPAFPKVQFETTVTLPARVSGWQRIDLVLHGGDGSVETWRGPRVRVRAAAQEPGS